MRISETNQELVIALSSEFKVDRAITQTQTLELNTTTTEEVNASLNYSNFVSEKTRRHRV